MPTANFDDFERWFRQLEFRRVVNGRPRRLRQHSVEMAMSEARWLPLLPNLAYETDPLPDPDETLWEHLLPNRLAPPGVLPFLSYVQPEGIQWWEDFLSVCRELFDRGLELYWLNVVCRLAQEDPTRQLLNAMAPRLPHVNLTANLVRTLVSRAKALQQRANATKAAAARQSIADTLDRMRRAKGRADDVLAKAMADSLRADPLLELMIKDRDSRPAPDWTGLPALHLLRNRDRRKKGRPGRELAELCLTLLCEHLQRQSCTKRPSYRAVAALLDLLFPNWIWRLPDEKLPGEVKRRRLDFRKTHDVEQLRAQVLKRYPQAAFEEDFSPDPA